MNKQDLIPIIVQEECAEVVQAISKVFRFGLSQVWNKKANKTRLEEEIGQLSFAIQQLIAEWDLSNENIDCAYQAKKATYKQWEKYFPKMLYDYRN